MLTTDDLARLRELLEQRKTVMATSGSIEYLTAHRKWDYAMGEFMYYHGDELLRICDAAVGLSDDMMDEALCSSAEAGEDEIIDGTHFAMLIDFMRMGTPEQLPLARRIMRAAFVEAFRLVPLATAKGGES